MEFVPLLHLGYKIVVVVVVVPVDETDCLIRLEVLGKRIALFVGDIAVGLADGTRRALVVLVEYRHPVVVGLAWKFFRSRFRTFGIRSFRWQRHSTLVQVLVAKRRVSFLVHLSSN